MTGKLKTYKVGANVSWNWMGRSIVGTVKEIFKQPVSRLIKGTTIKRNGSDLNPAYLVESKAGNLALKLHSELKASEATKSKSPRPTMFGD